MITTKHTARTIDARTAINEGLAADEPTTHTSNEPVTFRLVITTQVYENYGAHAWNGEGQCPQYWKAKGGNEYQVVLGDAATVIEMGSKAIRRLANQNAAKVARDDEYYDEYMISWQIVPSNEETYEEQTLREMCEWGMIDEETRQRRLKDLVLS